MSTAAKSNERVLVRSILILVAELLIYAVCSLTARAEDWTSSFAPCTTQVLVSNKRELSFQMHACEVTKHPKFEYTLEKDFTMQAWYAWGGTDLGSRVEFDFRVHFDFPDGDEITLEREWDKHTDYQGNWDDWRPFHLMLPAGTKIRLETNGWNPNPPTNWRTDIIVRLYAVDP